MERRDYDFSVSAIRRITLSPWMPKALANSVRRDGRVWPHSKPWFFESQRDTVEAINVARKERSKKAPAFEWKANALRHSFISYRLAVVEDVGKAVALLDLHQGLDHAHLDRAEDVPESRGLRDRALPTSPQT